MDQVLLLPIFQYKGAECTTKNGKIIKVTKKTESAGSRPSYTGRIGSKDRTIIHGDPVEPSDVTNWSERTSFRIGTTALTVKSIISDIKQHSNTKSIIESLNELADKVLQWLQEGSTLISHCGDLLRWKELENIENKKSLQRLEYERSVAVFGLQEANTRLSTSTASASLTHSTVPRDAPDTASAPNHRSSPGFLVQLSSKLKRAGSHGSTFPPSAPPKKCNSDPVQSKTSRDGPSISGYPQISEAIAADNIKLLPNLKNLTNVVNEKGQNTLHLAAIHGKQQLIEGLLKERQFELYSTDSAGNNCLHLASFHGQKNIVAYLLSIPMEQERTQQDGFTAFHCASSSQQLEIMKILHGNSAECVFFKDTKGRTAEYLAAENGHVEVLKWFHSQKLLSAKNRNTFDLGHSCAIGGHTQVLDWMLGISPDRLKTTDAQGRCPIHYAAELGHLQVLKWFESHEIALNVADSSGKQIAHFAALNGRINIITWLGEDESRRPLLSDTDLSNKKPNFYAEVYKETNPTDATIAQRVLDLLESRFR